jgi:hypothetical protein
MDTPPRFVAYIDLHIGIVPNVIAHFHVSSPSVNSVIRSGTGWATKEALRSLARAYPP